MGTKFVRINTLVVEAAADHQSGIEDSVPQPLRRNPRDYFSAMDRPTVVNKPRKSLVAMGIRGILQHKDLFYLPVRRELIIERGAEKMEAHLLPETCARRD